MAKIHDPQLLYPFTDYERQARRIPGDEIQSQFEEYRRSIRDLIQAVNSPTILPGTIGAEELAPDLLSHIIAKAVADVTAEVRRAQSAAQEAVQHRVEAAAFADAARTVLIASSKRLDQSEKADEAAIRAAMSAADSAVRAHNIATQVDNTTNDAARAAAVAEDWAYVSHDWAEHMPDTLPPNTLVHMNITGDHWSARWWANQAAGMVTEITDAAEDAIAAVDDFNDLYLGAFGLPPTTDNDGDPLQPGAMYFNTTSKAMFVWTGTAWQSMTGAGLTGGENLGPGMGVYADTVGSVMRFWTLRPQGLVSINSDANGIIINGMAPTWTDVTGKPSTFPSSPHVHPISDVTNLQANLNAKEPTIVGGTASQYWGGDKLWHTVDWYTQAQADTNYVNVGGDTMTGMLVLPGTTPTLGTHATNKTYVDTQDAARDTSINLKVAKAGDTMTGDLTITKANPAFYVNKAASGQTAFVIGRMGGSSRWALVLGDSTAESTGNKGSDFKISRYNDAGGTIDDPVSISRETGVFNFIKTPTVNGSPLIGGVTISDTPPVSPVPGQLWLESDSGGLFARWDDGSGSPSVQWVQVNGMADLASYVKKTGDTMSGTLSVADVMAVNGTNALVHLNKTIPGSYPSIYGLYNTLSRWAVTLGSGEAESGSNAGSNFQIWRYSDTGVAIDTPIIINRATGVVTATGLPPKPTTAAGIGQWMNFGAGTTNTALVLPAGGTWAYFFVGYTGALLWQFAPSASVAAGGTTVWGATANVYLAGICWRIA